MRKRAEEQLSAATAALVTQGNIEAEREAAEAEAAERLQVGVLVMVWYVHTSEGACSGAAAGGSMCAVCVQRARSGQWGNAVRASKACLTASLHPPCHARQPMFLVPAARGGGAPGC